MTTRGIPHCQKLTLSTVLVTAEGARCGNQPQLARNSVRSALPAISETLAAILRIRKYTRSLVAALLSCAAEVREIEEVWPAFAVPFVGRCAVPTVPSDFVRMLVIRPLGVLVLLRQLRHCCRSVRCQKKRSLREQGALLRQ